MKTTNYLANFKKNNTSQCGEDGVVEELLRRLNITTGNVLDIGAADGEWHSNTYTLLTLGFDVYAIEASDNAKKMLELKKSFPNLHPYQVRVDADKSSPNHINSILEKMNVPKDIEFMSLDIDSIDPWVLMDIDRLPKFFVAEIEPRYYPLDDIWHNPNGNRSTNPPQNLTGFGPMYKTAKAKGYRFIGQTSQNIWFLTNDLIKKINFPEILDVEELTNFNPSYLNAEDKTRWKNYYN